MGESTGQARQRSRRLRRLGCLARLVQRALLSGALGATRLDAPEGELAYDQVAPCSPVLAARARGAT